MTNPPICAVISSILYVLLITLFTLNFKSAVRINLWVESFLFSTAADEETNETAVLSALGASSALFGEQLIHTTDKTNPKIIFECFMFL